jgi:hypothetical protein
VPHARQPAQRAVFAENRRGHRRDEKKKGSVGNSLLKNLGAFEGTVYPVKPPHQIAEVAKNGVDLIISKQKT